MEKFRNSHYLFANIYGSNSYSGIHGKILFFEVENGILVVADIFGLPGNNEIYAMHIHEGESCTGNEEDPFKDAGSHYNPGNMKHPYHSGDLLPLFSNNGHAWYSFVTNRFKLDDIVSKTVIIHSKSDDFITQPSGNSGEKIACGIIKSSN